MNGMSTFERRLGDWLEEGPQTVPDWLVDQALDRAHATEQVRAGLRPRWLGGLRPVAVGRLMSLAAGATVGLAVVAAFVLGLLTGPRVGDEPTPHPSLTSSPGPPATVAPRPVTSIEFIDVLPGEGPAFASLVGLAVTSGPDAVWTTVFSGGGARLVRIDAATGAAAPISIPEVDGLLSPPIGAGDVLWTASAAGLHAVPSGGGEARTQPLGFVPAEVDVSAEGLWVARDGGVTLIDPATGVVLREVNAPAGTLPGRIIGGPAFGSLWACLDQGVLGRLDQGSGAVTGTASLPAGSDCHGRVFPVTGVEGLPDGILPLLASVVVDPDGAAVSIAFDVGAWSDVVAIDGRLWFLEIVRDVPGSTLALIELDPGSRRPARILTFEGDLHLNAAFESGYLAVAGDYLWILADPTPGGDDQPQIIRMPLSQLRGE